MGATLLDMQSRVVLEQMRLKEDRRALTPSSLNNNSRLRVNLNWTNSSTAPQLRGISHSALHSVMSTNSARLSMEFHETPLRNELNLRCETLIVNSDKN